MAGPHAAPYVYIPAVEAAAMQMVLPSLAAPILFQNLSDIPQYPSIPSVPE